MSWARLLSRPGTAAARRAGWPPLTAPNIDGPRLPGLSRSPVAAPERVGWEEAAEWVPEGSGLGDRMHQDHHQDIDIATASLTRCQAGCRCERRTHDRTRSLVRPLSPRGSGRRRRVRVQPPVGNTAIGSLPSRSTPGTSSAGQQEPENLVSTEPGQLHNS